VVSIEIAADVRLQSQGGVLGTSMGVAGQVKTTIGSRHSGQPLEVIRTDIPDIRGPPLAEEE
jgi:hypothetical protein